MATCGVPVCDMARCRGSLRDVSFDLITAFSEGTVTRAVFSRVFCRLRQAWEGWFGARGFLRDASAPYNF